MERARWQRIEAVVDAALEIATAERAAFVATACAGDPALRAEVEAFLAAEALASGFLETPVEHHAPALIETAALEGATAERTVGPYRLVRELGRGGMGSVFLAERADGQFEQRVALKLIRRGMDSEEIVRRFVAERQILARLEHPNVARLLDGGLSADGRPFFAMEHVEGEPITRWCDQRRLGVEARLELFLQVCAAVEHAHRNLVVHRDLKPNNILVTGDGQAKLLDFGIAKLLAPVGSGASLTRHDAQPMTPEYAAPEQVLGEPVTTATDVYALGLLLYELLAGRRACRIAEPSPAAIARAVLSEVPEPPSAAVLHPPRGADEPAADALAAARASTPARLARRLAGDLDNVVGKALRKESERRYPGVGALAEDLRRHLAGHPVSARRDTFAYRTRKFLARHKVGVAAAVLVALSLAAGTLGTLWQARVALREARKAEEVKSFVLGLWRLSDPNFGRGEELTARQLLDLGAARVEQELVDQPELQAEMLSFIGSIYETLGLYPEGRRLLERALALRRELYGENDLRVADTLFRLAAIDYSEGELQSAETGYRRTWQLRRDQLGATHPTTALAQSYLGRVQLDRGELEPAAELLAGAVEIHTEQARGDSLEHAADLNALGRLHLQKGELAEAEDFFRRALAMRRRLFGEEHVQTAESHGNIATLLDMQGRHAEAEPMYRAALATERKLYGPEHPEVATLISNLATNQLAQGHLGEAETLAREALATRRAIFGATSPRLANSLQVLAHILYTAGRPAEAEPLAREALARAETALGAEHPNVGRVRRTLALSLAAQGKRAEARAQLAAALAAAEASLGAESALARQLATELAELSADR